MTGADNISVVLYCYLRTLSVKVSRDTVHRLLSTPLGGGMRGISDALDALHIKNEVFRLLSRDYFLKLETPFITMLEVDKKSFCVVTKKDDFIVEFINGEGGKRHVKVDKFLQHWTGTVLLGEPTEATPNEQFYIMRNIVFYLLRYRFIIALLFVLILGLQTAFCQSRSLAFMFYLSVLFFGILVSVAILYKERVNGEFMERFCNIGKIVNCNEVFHSKGASIAGLGLGELSLLYFAPLYPFSLIRQDDFYIISVVCCVVAVTLSLYSIIYQVFILRKACMLCVLADFAVWGSAVALYILKNDFVMELSLSSLFAFVVIGYICLIFELQLRAIQTGEKERITLKKYFGSLLNPETFQILLALKPQIGKMVSRDIALHNQKEGSNELMIVTNPNCKNCASVHRHIVEIASSVPVSLVLVTFPNDRLGEEIAQIIIAAYYVVGWDRAIELLGEWYENRHMEDAGIYSITAEVRDVWTKQQIYCREQKISKTPSVIVNKHYVPEVYPLSDLRYVLT